MRANTIVWAKFESVGKPNQTTTHNGDIRYIATQFAAWLLSTPMGHKMRITLARTEGELNDRRSADKLELMEELESILANEAAKEQE